jgi:imidazolonepropionase-like amidohydrolase
VVISAGKIAAVGPFATTAVPKGAEVLDRTGSTVLPGLVGMHDHLFYPAGEGIFHEMPRSFPRLYLATGVTTIRTTGSLEPYADLELKKEIDSGKQPGPHIWVTGPYLEGEGSFALQMHAIRDPEDARRTVEFWADQGVTSFKAYNFITRAQLGAAIQAAHKRGLKVTGHLCSVGFTEAAALGIDDLEHGLIVDTEFYSGKKPDDCSNRADRAARAELARMDVDSPAIQQLIGDLVKRHVAITSTLPVFELFDPSRSTQPRALEAMSLDTRALYLQNQLAAAHPAPGSPDYKKLLHLEMQFERAFVAAGGTLLAGCDPTGNGGVLAGYGDQRGVELLVEAGFTPVEAIRIATFNGAQFLGQAEHIGSLAAGKVADLILVDGDPSKQIADVEKVEVVFKDGIGYDPAKLIDSVRGTVGLR